MATSTAPSRHGRPNVSVMITPTSRPSRAASVRRRHDADASGSRGSRVTNPRGAFDASTPALAQMNPWRVSAMMMPRSMRTIRLDSRRTTSTTAGSFPYRAAQSRARGDGATSASGTTAPSAFDTNFCATTNTSPSSIAIADSPTAAAIDPPRSIPAVASARSGIAKTCSDWLSVRVDFLRLDLDDDPHLARRAEGIFVLVQIFLRHLVDVRVRALLGHLDDAALDAQIAVRILGIEDR